MRFRASPTRWILLPLALLLASHAIWGILWTHVSGDPFLYDISSSLVDGQGYSACIEEYFPLCHPGDATAAREPIPVWFFAIITWLMGPSMTTNVIGQTALNFGTGILIYAIARRLFADHRVGLFALTMWAVYPPSLRFITNYKIEPVFAFTLAAALLALIHALDRPQGWRFVLAGALFGLAMLSRSVLMYTVVFLPLGFWFTFRSRQTLVRLALFGAAAAVVIAPWVIRNERVFGHIIPGTTLNGYNLFRYTHGIAEDHWLSFDSADETFKDLQDDLMQEQAVHGDEDEYEMNRLYMDEAKEGITQYPLRYAVLVLYQGVADQWLDVGDARIYGYSYSIYQWFVVLTNLVLLPLAIWGAWRFPRSSWRLAWPVVGVFMFFNLIQPLVVARFRYLVPMMPYVFMFAVAASLPLLDRLILPRLRHVVR
jgi:4-amino-4-deoxy-L-arabinose transferase-like glycosyltransferase